MSHQLARMQRRGLVAAGVPERRPGRVRGLDRGRPRRHRASRACSCRDGAAAGLDGSARPARRADRGHRRSPGPPADHPARLAVARMRKATVMTDGTSPGDLRYVSRSARDGYAPARASGANGSIQLSLDGIWKFRYSQGLGDLTAGSRPRTSTPPISMTSGPFLVAAGRRSRPPPVRLACVHQRDLSLPGGPAPRPRREPHRRVPRHFTLPPGWEFSGSTVVRFDGMDSCFAVFVNGTAVGHSKGSRLSGSSTSRTLSGRRQRHRGTRAPVVSRVLSRGPGHVVALRDLPQRDGPQRAARLRSGTSSSTPTTTPAAASACSASTPTLRPCCRSRSSAWPAPRPAPSTG